MRQSYDRLPRPMRAPAKNRPIGNQLWNRDRTRDVTGEGREAAGEASDHTKPGN